MQTGDAFTNDPYMAIFVFFKYWTNTTNSDFTFQASIFGRAQTRTTHVTIFLLQNTTLRMLLGKSSLKKLIKILYAFGSAQLK